MGIVVQVMACLCAFSRSYTDLSCNFHPSMRNWWTHMAESYDWGFWWRSCVRGKSLIQTYNSCSNVCDRWSAVSSLHLARITLLPIHLYN